MPNRPLHPCGTPGCSELVAEGHCATHTRVIERYRGTAASRGYDARHRKWRILVLARDPLCRGCEGALSTDADHVVPLAMGGSWDLRNGQGLCKACHGWKTAKEQGDPFLGMRLADAGNAVNEPAPSGWRKGIA